MTIYSLLSLARNANPFILHLKYNLLLKNMAILSSCKYSNAILTCFIASFCQARYITLLACVSLYASYFFIFVCIAKCSGRFKHRIMSYKALTLSNWILLIKDLSLNISLNRLIARNCQLL